MKKETVLYVMIHNAFKHPNFWNFGYAKNRLHVLLLMLVPIIPGKCIDKSDSEFIKDIEKFKKMLKYAELNFWSTCGNSDDYEHYINIRKKYAALVGCKADPEHV